MTSTTPDPIHDLLRAAMADLLPRMDIASRNITTLYEQRTEQEQILAELIAQYNAYRAGLPDDEDDDDDEPTTET